jgi:hypothetical protein
MEIAAGAGEPRQQLIAALILQWKWPLLGAIFFSGQQAALLGCDPHWRLVDGPTSFDMAKHNGAGDQHHRSSNAAEHQSEET